MNGLAQRGYLIQSQKKEVQRNLKRAREAHERMEKVRANAEAARVEAASRAAVAKAQAAKAQAAKAEAVTKVEQAKGEAADVSEELMASRKQHGATWLGVLGS